MSLALFALSCGLRHSRADPAPDRTMAGIGLIALLDDIASVLDDVAVLTKVATKKTAGVLGDDLALNAQQVSGVRAERELPVVWAVAKGSALNKAILVPAALAISAFAPCGHHAAADGGRRLPLLRRLREARAPVPASAGRARSGTRRAHARGRRSGHRPGRVRAGEDQGRDPHRLHPVRRDRRHRARHRRGRRVRHAGRDARRHRDPDDGRRLRAGRRHREARRRGAVPESSAKATARSRGSSARSAAASCARRRGS